MKRKVILIVMLIGVALFESYSLIPVLNYKGNKLPGSIILQDRNGIEITNKANKYGYSLPRNDSISEIWDSKFVESLIKIEDKNYKHHLGFDIISKIRAIKNNIINLKIVSGGSTITEQYIKNKYFKWNDRTILQKLREANNSILLSLTTGKKEVMADYLDTIYFGDNIYGIYGAIDKYFNKKSILDLSDEEITILLTKVRLPSLSFESGRFTRYYHKIKAKLDFQFRKNIYTIKAKDDLSLFPFVTNEVTGNDKRFVNKKISIDKNLQEYSELNLFSQVTQLKKKNVTNGAAIGINPYSREILFYVGGKDFNESEVNILKKRNLVGSTLKPFLYLFALKQGANPDDYLIDFRANIKDTEDDSHYISRNYSLKEFGAIRFKEAIGNSLNNTAIRLIDYLGLEDFYNFSNGLGIDYNSNYKNLGPGIVLGTAELTLENLVNSYAGLLPNIEIDGKNANFSLKNKGDYRKKLTTDEDKFLLMDILKNPNNRGISFGVKSILNTSIPQSVKTGTSNDFRDNLVVSYGNDMIIGVWVGNNDNTPMKGVTGITGAGQIWHNITEKAIELGYIKEDDRKYGLNKVEKYYGCLDFNCYMRETSYKKKGKNFNSFDRENIIDLKDFFIKPTDEELQKLNVSGFTIK